MTFRIRRMGRRRRARIGRLAFVIALAAALYPLATAAEPARADAAFAAHESAPPLRPRALGDFTLAGAAVAVIATGRSAQLDTELQRDHLEEAIEMRAVLPGYPQPAQATLALKVSF